MPTTRSGLVKVRPVGPGSRIALVAPASPFARAEFDLGLEELQRLELVPIYDERVFDREEIVAGSAQSRAQCLQEYCTRSDIDGVLAVRGGYGSVETLPLLDIPPIIQARTALIGYSDITSLHSYWTCHAGLVSIHGPMIDGRIAKGAAAFDASSFLASVSVHAAGPLAHDGVEVLRQGEAEGPLFGGTLTQLVASLGTPFAFAPPRGHVLFIDEVAERPYRLRRMLVQLKHGGILGRAAAVVIGQLPRCDEPERPGSGRAVVAQELADFPGPVLFGFPSGHTVTPLLSLPLGVHCRVVTSPQPALILEEAAAA